MGKSAFSDRSFWNKLSKSAKKAGREVVERALQLHYIAQSPDTPMPIKTLIYSALIYFIVPIDAIPDVLPGGFVDDLGALGAVLVSVTSYLTPEIKRQAEEEVSKRLGDG